MRTGSHCEGCVVDHPSQLQHDCVMLSFAELLDRYLETFLNDLRENTLENCVDAWLNEISQHHLLKDYMYTVVELTSNWSSYTRTPRGCTTRRTYEAQEQLGCEECEKGWQSQYDHACLFLGMNPICCVSDYGM
jgi:hypothetical protein